MRKVKIVFLLMVAIVSLVGVTWPARAEGTSCQQKWVSQPPPGSFVMVCTGGDGGGSGAGGPSTKPTPVPSCTSTGEIVNTASGYYATDGACYAASFGLDNCGSVLDVELLDGASAEQCTSSAPEKPAIYPCVTAFRISPIGVFCEPDTRWNIKAAVQFPSIGLDARPYPATLVRWDTALRLGDMPPHSGSGHSSYVPLGGGSDGSPAPGDWRDLTLTLTLAPLSGSVTVDVPTVGSLRLPMVGPTGNPTIFRWQVPSHPAAGAGPLAGQVGQLGELPADMPLFVISGTKAPYQLLWKMNYYQWESDCVDGPADGGGTNCHKNSDGDFTGHKEWGWQSHSDGGVIPPSAVQNLPSSLAADLNGDGVPDAYWDRLVQIRRMDNNNRIDNPQWKHTYSWDGSTWYWAVREGQGQIGWP